MFVGDESSVEIMYPDMHNCEKISQLRVDAYLNVGILT